MTAPKAFAAAVSLVVCCMLAGHLAFGALPRRCAGESTHPKIRRNSARSPTRTGSRSTNRRGDVYVADIGTDTVYKFDADRQPGRILRRYGLQQRSPAPPHRPDRSRSPKCTAPPRRSRSITRPIPSDPSAGDLYVMDAGHGVIDKFSPEGTYLSQIGGFTPSTGSAEGELLGLGVDGSGTVHVDLSTRIGRQAADRRIRRRGRESSRRSPGMESSERHPVSGHAQRTQGPRLRRLRHGR